MKKTLQIAAVAAIAGTMAVTAQSFASASVNGTGSAFITVVNGEVTMSETEGDGEVSTEPAEFDFSSFFSSFSWF